MTRLTAVQRSYRTRVRRGRVANLERRFAAVSGSTARNGRVRGEVTLHGTCLPRCLTTTQRDKGKAPGQPPAGNRRSWRSPPQSREGRIPLADRRGSDAPAVPAGRASPAQRARASTARTAARGRVAPGTSGWLPWKRACCHIDARASVLPMDGNTPNVTVDSTGFDSLGDFLTCRDHVLGVDVSLTRADVTVGSDAEREDIDELIGYVLRYCPGLRFCAVTDHGGNGSSIVHFTR